MTNKVNTTVNNDLYNLAALKTGATWKNNSQKAFDEMMPGFVAWEAGAVATGWGWKNKGDLRSGLNQLKTQFQQQKNVFSSLVNDANGKKLPFLERYNNVKNYNKLMRYEAALPKVQQVDPSAFSRLGPASKANYIGQQVQSGWYSNLEKEIKKGKNLRGTQLNEQVKKVKAEAKIADNDVNEIKKAKLTKAEKARAKELRKQERQLRKAEKAEAKELRKQAKADNKATTKADRAQAKELRKQAKANNNTTTTKTKTAKTPRVKTPNIKGGGNVLKTAGKVCRGKGAFAAVSLVAEVPEIAETYKTLGTKKGNIQVLKSTTVVAAEIGGFAVGAKAGAALGTAIGTVVPGVGNVVGAVLGFAIGGLCGWLAGKATRKVVGPSELDKAREEDAQTLAAAAGGDEDIKTGLLIDSQERIAQIDPKDKAAQAAVESFDRLAEEHNATLIAQNSTHRTTTPQNNASSNVNYSKPNNISENLWKQLNGLMNYSTNTASMNYNNFNTNFNPYMFQAQYPSIFGGQGYNPYSMYPQFGFIA